MEKTFYLHRDDRWNAEFSPIEVFDTWACEFYEEITGVNRNVWDVFARWKFINTRIDRGKMEKQYQADGSIFLVEVEEKSSESPSEMEEGK
jgi:serine/threonine protein kinase HipA of HipAB toxin-antitoxin module